MSGKQEGVNYYDLQHQILSAATASLGGRAPATVAELREWVVTELLSDSSTSPLLPSSTPHTLPVPQRTIDSQSINDPSTAAASTTKAAPPSSFPFAASNEDQHHLTGHVPASPHATVRPHSQSAGSLALASVETIWSRVHSSHSKKRNIGARLIETLATAHRDGPEHSTHARGTADLEHISSTLELKEQLSKPQYFTQVQLDNQRFARISRGVRSVMTPLAIALIFFRAAAFAARVGLSSSRLNPNFAWGELAVDCLWFIIIVGMGLTMPYEEGGHVEHDRMRIARRYLTDPRLALFDVVSSFPVLIVLAPLGLLQFEYAHVNVLLREIQLPQLIEKLQEQLPGDTHPGLLRLMSYAMYLLLIITHLSTVLMAVMLSQSPAEVLAWMGMSIAGQLDANPWYWFSRSWLETLRLVAEKRLPYPNTDLEYGVGIVLVFFGLVTISVIIASVEEIIVDAIERGNQLSGKIEVVLNTLETMGIPPHLQQEIVEYYQSMWEINRTFDFNSKDLLSELPDLLRADVEYECNARVIRAISLFAKVAENPDFVRLLAGQVQQVVVMPGAPIVQKDEEGDCMFFISSGVASVMNEEGTEEVMTLGAGSFFGEATMLFGGTRNRDIIAKTRCVCSVISDEQFERVVDVFPEALEEILNAAVERLKKQQQQGTAPPGAGGDATMMAAADEVEMAHAASSVKPRKNSSQVEPASFVTSPSLFSVAQNADVSNAGRSALMRAQLAQSLRFSGRHSSAERGGVFDSGLFDSSAIGGRCSGGGAVDASASLPVLRVQLPEECLELPDIR